MAFYGIGGGTIGTTSMVRGIWALVNLHSTTDWADLASNDLSPGMYQVFFSMSPSINDGDYNNSDPDAYQIRCLYDGNSISATPTGYESAPHMYKQAISICFVIGWTSGTKTVKFQARTTDSDAGGLRGAGYCTISRIMDYS